MVNYLQDKNNQLFLFVMASNLGVFLLVGLEVLRPTWLAGSGIGGFFMLTHSTLIPLLVHVMSRMKVQVGPGFITPSIEPEPKPPPEPSYKDRVV